MMRNGIRSFSGDLRRVIRKIFLLRGVSKRKRRSDC